MKNIDWIHVYLARDLDHAVECFTEKVNYVLDKHAPWVKFQKRKYFCPSLTKRTLELIGLRDAAKKKYEALCSSSGLEKENAWQEFKKLRNKANNLKKQDLIKFNKEKILKNLEDPAKM